MSFWNELKRRNVVKVGATYLIVAWLLTQVVATVEGPLNLPGAVATAVIVLLGVGFPVALLLAWAYEMTPDGIASHVPSREAAGTRPAAGSPFAGAVPLLILAAVAFLIVDEYLFDRPADPIAAAPREVTGMQRTSLLLPSEHMISFGWYPGRSLAISPDGRTVVYVAIAEDATPADLHLAVRTLDSPTVRALPGTDGGHQPFLSPDGTSVAFFTDQALKKISLSGGNAIPLVDDINGGAWSFGVWLDDGTIVFGGVASNGLRRVSENGGDVEQLTELNPVAPKSIHLPSDNYGVLSASRDGRYLALTAGNPGSLTTEVRIHDLDRRTSTRLTERGRDGGPEWHPDGQSIAFNSATSEQQGLYIGEVGGEPRLLVPREAGSDGPGVGNVTPTRDHHRAELAARGARSEYALVADLRGTGDAFRGEPSSVEIEGPMNPRTWRWGLWRSPA